MSAIPPGDDGPVAAFAGMRQQVRQAVALLQDAVLGRAERFGLIVAISVLAAALEGGSLVVLPALLGAGSNASSISSAPAALGTAAALYLALVGAAAILLYLQTVASNQLTRAFGDTLRTRLHAAVMRAGWGSPALARPADLVHALDAEAAQCAYATEVAVKLATRLISLPALLAAALILSPGLTLMALVLAALAGLPLISLARRSYALAGVVARAARRYHAVIADELAGLKPIKMHGAEAARRAALSARLDEVREAEFAQARAVAAVRAWQRLAGAVTAAAGAVYGLSVLRLDGAAMLALALALARLAANVSQTLELWRQLGRVLPVYGHFCACEALCQSAAEPQPTAAVPYLRHSLRLSGVGFTHLGAQAATLAGLDLTIPARGITALIGSSGAGKSTLADIVMGLVPPTRGVVAVDGVPLDGPARVAWRSRVAYVAQEPFLFHDTVRANLCLASADAGAAEMERVLEAAAATFALRLPQGLDTVVGERGGRLSGGERQRLTIARALLGTPDLLVLDEATSALDLVSEAKVVAALRELSRHMAILAITHRSAVIDAADRVLHLEDGKLVEPSSRGVTPRPPWTPGHGCREREKLCGAGAGDGIVVARPISGSGRMLDLATATLASFAPHVGTTFVLDHAGHRETFTLRQADPAAAGWPDVMREPFTLLFDGARTDLQFDQQILPLTHAALGAMELFLVPVARNPEGTVRYQAVFN